VTVTGHPALAAAEARGDLAESMVMPAMELAFLVRDEDRETIGAWMDSCGIPADQPVRALLVVLAAMVDVDRAADDLLAYVTWDEHGRPLEGMTPVLPIFTAPDDYAADHGSWAAYVRHMRAGERDRVALEACGCAEAARAYSRERRAARAA
jgi:hypothetical protein